MKKRMDRRPQSMSRRVFLKLAALFGFMSGCKAARQSSPTPSTVPTHTPKPIHTPIPTSIPAADLRHPEIIKFHPDAPSKVVHTHHAGVWDGESLVPKALREMLDTSITKLSGLDDAIEAWAALFDPKERIAIKVNTLRGSNFWTHIPLVTAIAESLQEAGIPAEQIFVFDRLTSELENAGFPINKNGPGVRCFGTDYVYTSGWKLVGSDIQLSDILLGCHALINVPVLKEHSLSGMSFAMKNHYGTFDAPERYHYGDAIERGIAELNALPPIKDRARLIVGDALATCARRQGVTWDVMADDAISMSFDPVAHDVVGMQWLIDAWSSEGLNEESTTSLAAPWMQNGVELGVGTNDLNNIEVIELNLT